jgi:putative heme-binding domain-containing protein
LDQLALAMVDFKPDEAVDVLRSWMIRSRTARPAIEALLSSHPEIAAQSAVDWMLASRPAESRLSQDDLSRLFRSFVNRQDGPAVLAQALAGQQIVPDAAVIGLRVTSSTGQPFPELDAALTAAGGVITGPVVLSDSEMADMVAFVETNGDAHRGEEIFRRADLNCFKCHSIGDAGGIVGPNLVSLGATAQLDYLINSLLDPNKNVKENFHTTVIATLDGDIISGIKVRESANEIVVRNAEDAEVTIPADQVDEQAVGTSMMPTGLTQKLTLEEMADLVAFLSALGRVPEFTVQRDPVVRRWLVMQPTDTALHQLSRTSYASAAEDLPAFQWSPAYSRVTGSLPVAELPELSIRNRTAEGSRGVSFVRCEFDVTQTGAATLQFGDASGLSGWLDLEPLDLATGAPVELTPGRHRLTFVIDRALHEGEISLRVETAEGAVVEIVGGK